VAYKIPILYIPFLYTFYIVISAYLFVITSVGWISLITIPIMLVLVIIFIISILLISLKYYRKSIKIITFPVKSFYFLLLIQFFTLLFNYSDGADSGSGRFFYQYYMSHIPGYTLDIIYPIAFIMMPISCILYVVFHIRFLAQLFNMNLSSPKLKLDLGVLKIEEVSVGEEEKTKK